MREMTNNEFRILKAGQDGLGKRLDGIDGRIDKLPCFAHLDRLSTVETRLDNGEKYEQRQRDIEQLQLNKSGLTWKKTGAIILIVSVVVVALNTVVNWKLNGG